MINKYIGVGRLANDPEIRHTQSGTSVATFTLCCEYGWGENKKTEFVRCVAWSKLADICGEYLRKGSLAYVEGNLETRSWDDKSGNKRYSTEVKVHEMKMLSGRSDNLSSGERHQVQDAKDTFKTDGDFPF